MITDAQKLDMMTGRHMTDGCASIAIISIINIIAQVIPAVNYQ